MSKITTIDQAGIDFLTKEEGVILHPYRDSRGIPTIGIGMTFYPGTTRRVTMTDAPITLLQAKNYLAQMVKSFEQAVASETRDDLTQNQLNALVSLTYNIGPGGFKGSTVRKVVNAKGSNEALKAAFLLWSRAGSDATALRGRRIREFMLYLKP